MRKVICLVWDVILKLSLDKELVKIQMSVGLIYVNSTKLVQQNLSEKFCGELL